MGSQRGVRQGVSTVTARTTWPCFHAGMSPNHMNTKGHIASILTWAALSL